MTSPSRKLLAAAATVVAAAGVAACGSQGIEVARDDPMREGAVLFRENCAGCHTLEAAGTEGSATSINDRERVDGPNFNQRKETVEQVLYAIRNGGFSGAIMPENIVTGEDARKVAEFLAEYSGREAADTPAPESGEQQSGDEVE
jgi:mono/diheme cytochrome c family protein